MTRTQPHPYPEPGPRPCPLGIPILAAALLAPVACGDREDIFDTPRNVSPPLALAGHVAYLDRTRQELVTLRPVAIRTGFAFDIVRQRVGRNPIFAAATIDKTRVLVVTHGTGGGPGLAEEAEMLTAFDPAGLAQAVRYPIGSPFDTLDLSPDGRWAVARFSAPGAVNPNELSIVRIDRAPMEGVNPARRSLRSYGDRPLGLRFLSDIPIGGDPRQIVMALSVDYVTMFDLEHLDRRDTTIRLRPPGDETAGPVTPEDVVVAKDHVTGSSSEPPYVFLRARGSSDIYSAALLHTIGAAADQNDFHPTVNVVSVAGPPEDFTVFTRAPETAGDPAEVRLIAVGQVGYRSSVVSIIDPRTTTRWDVPLEAPANRVLLFHYVDRRGEARDVALLWQSTSVTLYSRGSFLDLAGVEERGTLNLEIVDFGAAVREVVPTADPVRVLLVHDSVSRVSILDVAERTVDPVGTGVSQDLFAMHPEGRALYFATPYAERRVSVLDLDTKHAEGIRLDAPPVAILALAGGPSTPERTGRALIVDHGWSSGYLTALPLDAPKRSGASSIQGFLAAGILDLDADRYRGREAAP